MTKSIAIIALSVLLTACGSSSTSSTVPEQPTQPVPHNCADDTIAYHDQYDWEDDFEVTGTANILLALNTCNSVTEVQTSSHEIRNVYVSNYYFIQNYSVYHSKAESTVHLMTPTAKYSYNANYDAFHISTCEESGFGNNWCTPTDEYIYSDQPDYDTIWYEIHQLHADAVKALSQTEYQSAK